jgi:hypothetical protein
MRWRVFRGSSHGAATSDPEGKPGEIDTVPEIPTPMSGAGGIPVVL